MKRILTFLLAVTLLTDFAACSNSDEGGAARKPGIHTDNRPEQNLRRAMAIIDSSVEHFFAGNGMSMSRFFDLNTYLPGTETGSVWHYTSSIEAVNAVMHGLKALKEAGKPELYDQNFERYKELLAQLYNGLSYYRGTYTLTSFTQTRSWSVYGVNRSSGPDGADVTGVMNVYDDQMWLIRELFEAYTLTGEEKYLTEAEYLAEYVLDGWDCTIDASGNERGGITWGPGYYSKHSCSNGPVISPLVWLHEHYKGKTDKTTYRYIDSDKHTRKSREMTKAEYYLMYARKVYDFQMRTLYYEDQGTFADNLNSPTEGGTIRYENVNGVNYRKPSDLKSKNGPAISYNSGSMLSGAADLYRVTGDQTYLENMRTQTGKSFAAFATPSSKGEGLYEFDRSGYRTWFDGVLMRGYVDAAAHCSEAEQCIAAFQNNLDYGYDHYYKNSFLPVNLLLGWGTNTNVEGMFEFTYAAEYALLARYELEKAN